MIGASIGAIVLTKDTEAFIGKNADVTALGARPGIGYNAGDFAVSFVPDAGGTGEVTVPSILNGLLKFLTDAFDLNPLRKAAHDAVKTFTNEAAGKAASDALDIFKVSAPSPDPKFSQKRVSTPRTFTNSGLSVTATSRDDIETLSVGLGAAGTCSCACRGCGRRQQPHGGICRRGRGDQSRPDRRGTGRSRS